MTIIYKPRGGAEGKGLIQVDNLFIPQDPDNYHFFNILQQVEAGIAKIAKCYTYDVAPPEDLEAQISAAIDISTPFSHLVVWRGQWQIFFEDELDAAGKSALDSIMGS